MERESRFRIFACCKSITAQVSRASFSFVKLRFDTTTLLLELIFVPCDLDLCPFDLEHLQCIACDVTKLCSLPNLNKIELSAAELLRFKYLT